MADFGEVVVKEWEPHDLSNIDYLTVTFRTHRKVGIHRNAIQEIREGL